MEGSNSEPAVPDGSSSSSDGTDQQPSQSDAQQGAITNDTAATTTEDPEETVVNNESSNGWYSSWKTGFASSFTANALVVPGLLLALFGFVWMVLSQRWTMKNDKLQDCINLRQIAVSSKACNETIDAGLPSFWRKRGIQQARTLSIPPSILNSIAVGALLLSCLLAYCILKTISWIRNVAGKIEPLRLLKALRMPRAISHAQIATKVPIHGSTKNTWQRPLQRFLDQGIEPNVITQPLDVSIDLERGPLVHPSHAPPIVTSPDLDHMTSPTSEGTPWTLIPWARDLERHREVEVMDPEADELALREAQSSNWSEESAKEQRMFHHQHDTDTLEAPGDWDQQWRPGAMLLETLEWWNRQLSPDVQISEQQMSITSSLDTRFEEPGLALHYKSGNDYDGLISSEDNFASAPPLPSPLKHDQIFQRKTDHHSGLRRRRMRAMRSDNPPQTPQR